MRAGLRFEVIDTASPGLRPSKPNKHILLVIFLATGIIFVVGLAAIVAGFINRNAADPTAPLARKT